MSSEAGASPRRQRSRAAVEGERRPLVTLALLALCLLAFLPTWLADRGRRESSSRAAADVLDYVWGHPYLELDRRVERFLAAQASEHDSPIRSRETTDTWAHASEPDPPIVAEEQRLLDDKVSAAFASFKGRPGFLLGLVSDRIRPWAPLTHPFIHWSWLHLGGTLLFVALVGFFVEIEWQGSRWLYPAFLLGAAVVAVCSDLLVTGAGSVPLVGGAGLCAALMGAFVVAFGFTSVPVSRVLPRVGLSIPVWVLVVFWLATLRLFNPPFYGYAMQVGGLLFGAGVSVAGTRIVESLRRREAAAAAGTRVHPRTESAVAASAASLPPRPQHLSDNLHVVAGIPTKIQGGCLTLEVQGSPRLVALDRVAAVAVARIAPEEQRPYVVVDLLLDWPRPAGNPLRVLRLWSTGFDPRKVVPGRDVAGAFRKLIESLLATSGGIPLPDETAARGRPFCTFPTIEDYQREVLGDG